MAASHTTELTAEGNGLYFANGNPLAVLFPNTKGITPCERECEANVRLFLSAHEMFDELARLSDYNTDPEFDERAVWVDLTEQAAKTEGPKDMTAQVDAARFGWDLAMDAMNAKIGSMGSTIVNKITED